MKIGLENLYVDIGAERVKNILTYCYINKGNRWEVSYLTSVLIISTPLIIRF